eukprot:TRINITY_DN2180_c0_g3_i1.p1 TRINITY_DN2180_c0_g3~~TRINITY_DN2180_c0_g3_i1.p1  ORF type:complete len:184 (+),score=63.38 TRINITY_DN2180_c0_g3_i1:212-763(+)
MAGEDGWIAYEDKDAFAGEECAKAPRPPPGRISDEEFLKRVKEACQSKGFGGFRMDEDGAHFRRNEPHECRENITDGPGGTFYVHGPSCFGPGQRVKTFGLKTESLNGIEGKVVRTQEVRVVVDLGEKGEKALKPQNLEALEPPPQREHDTGSGRAAPRVQTLADEEPIPPRGRVLSEYMKKR